MHVCLIQLTVLSLVKNYSTNVQREYIINRPNNEEGVSYIRFLPPPSDNYMEIHYAYFPNVKTAWMLLI